MMGMKGRRGPRSEAIQVQFTNGTNKPAHDTTKKYVHEHYEHVSILLILSSRCDQCRLLVDGLWVPCELCVDYV